MQVISHNTPYSHRKEIRWDKITNEAAGVYVCRANIIKDDQHENKTWELNVVPTVVPVIQDTNIENGKVLKLALGDPLVLRCRFSGIPHPTITWYKSGDVITSEGENARISLHENNTELNIHNVKREDQGKYECVAGNRVGRTSIETILEISGKIGCEFSFERNVFINSILI